MMVRERKQQLDIILANISPIWLIKLEIGLNYQKLNR